MCIICIENYIDGGTCTNIAATCPSTIESVVSCNFDLFDEITNLSGDSVPNDNGDLVSIFN